MGPAAVVFDAYGTLLDVGSVGEACAGLAPDPPELVRRWRAKQLEYAFLRGLMGAHAYADFWQVTADALDFAAESLGLALAPAARERALAGWLGARPFPEVGAAIERLAGGGRRLAILSNGTPEMLRAALRAPELAGRFAHVLSVDAVRSYKPDPRVYRLATDALAAPAAEVLFVSSNGWDAAGAAAFGFQVAWLNRAAAPAERLGFPPRLTLPDLAALAAELAGD